jgi:hypothetical protein
MLIRGRWTIRESGGKRRESGGTDLGSQVQSNVASFLAGLLPGDPQAGDPAMTVRTEGNKVQSIRSPSERNDAQHWLCEKIIVQFRII